MWDIGSLVVPVALCLAVGALIRMGLHAFDPPPMDRATCERKLDLYLYRYGHDPSKYWECVELMDGGWAMIDRLHD